MGIPGSGAGILHPQMKNRFRITFYNIGALVPGANSRDLTRQVTSLTMPNQSAEEVVLHRYNSTAYIAGKNMWEPVSVTFEDDITGLADQVITAQLETQQRVIGSDLDQRWFNTAATGSDYKFACAIDQLDGDEGIVNTWFLEGTWIQNVDRGDRDYSTSEAATVTVTLRFDNARKVVVNQNYGSALGGAVAG